MAPMARRQLTDRIAAATTLMAAGALLCASSAASANWRWCCDNPSHAGGTAEERCERNNAVFPSAERCAAHKAEHDRATGHSSRCEPAAPRTERGTPPAGATERQ